jgi:hypothetical protein
MLGAVLLQLAALATASPVQVNNDIVQRDAAASASTTTTTVWIDPTTVTVNPRDPTITREAGWTSTAAPPPFTSTITSSCVTYSYRLPPGNPVPPVETSTVTTRSTVTVTDTKRPLTTQFTFHTPTVTVTTPLATYVSYHCLNTLIVQYANWEYLTWTWSLWEHTATTTGLCLTSSTRSTTIPGVTLPTDTTTLQDWEYFSDGTSVATKNTVAIADDVTSTFPGTVTTTVCKGNPTPTTTTTITINRPTATTTVCAKGGSRRAEGGNVRREVAANTPVEVKTVVYTTVTVISNTVHTFTGTAVVDINTQEFPVTRIAYVTNSAAATVTGAC